MTAEATIRERRSIRKFLDKPVTRAEVEAVLDLARWSPSWGNTQSWEVAVLMGAPLEAYRKANREALMAGSALAPDIPMPEAWPAEQKERYMDVGRRVLTALDIPREDRAARDAYYADMASFFGAPCLVVVLVPETVAVEYAMLDVGLFVQTLCLAATSRGLGTCILANAVNRPGPLHETAGIPRDRKIAIGVALGWPDAASPVNTFERSRTDLARFVTWIGA